MNFGGFDVNYSESGVDLIKPAVSPSTTRFCDLNEIWHVHSESKNPPCGFLTFFSKRLEIFIQFFTHYLYVRIYA